MHGGTAADSYAERPVLDLPALLKRVKDDAALAARLLDDFRRTHAETHRAIAAAQAEGRAADAHRLAHTLAGLAGNLGLARLSGAARSVEDALSSGTVAAVSLDALAAELAQAMAAAESLKPPPPVPQAAASGDPTALAASLDQLLAENDLDALQRAAEFEAAAPSAAARAVREAVERLDFKAARTLLAPLRESGHG